MTASETTSAPHSLLENRDYILVVAVRVLSQIAIQTQSVAVGWYVYNMTDSALALGYIGLSGFLPMALFVLPGGDLADRFSRRLILAVSYVIMAVTAALFVGLALADVREPWPFYLVMGLFGFARSLNNPASQSIIPNLVPTADVPRAVSLATSMSQSAIIIGPALGGFIYLLGPAQAFGLSLAAYTAAGIAIANVRVAQRIVAEPGSTAFGRFLAGASFVGRRPTILGGILLDLFAVILGGATALLPIYARDILHVGAFELGMLRSAPAIGAAATALWLGHFALKRHAGVVMLVAVAGFGIGTIVFGMSTDFYLSLAALIVLGVTDMISVYVRQTMIMLSTPDNMRGRVSAVNMLFISASNELGEFRAGTAAAFIGAAPAVIFGGVGTILVVAICALAIPELRRVDRLAALTPENTPVRGEHRA